MIMEIIEVVGLREVNFTDDNGRTVSGTSIYFLMASDGVDGKMSGKLFVSNERKKQMSYFPLIGDEVAVNYDRFGKPADFKPV